MSEIEDLSDSDEDDDHETKTDGHICTEPDEEQPKAKAVIATASSSPEQPPAASEASSTQATPSQAVKMKAAKGGVQKKPGRFAGKQAYNQADDYDNYDSHYDDQYGDFDM